MSGPARRRAVRSRVALALALGLASLGCRDAGTRLHWGLERMLDQRHRFDAYEPAEEVFADGKVMREPPEGTVHREAVLGPHVLVHGHAPGGAHAMAVPYVLTRDFLERGRDRFEIYCAACHGLLGDGASPVASSMTLVKPPSFHTPEMRGRPPGHFYHVVTNGYGLMPAYREELTIEDRWAVVAYVLALQLSQAVELEALPARMRREFREEVRP